MGRAAVDRLRTAEERSDVAGGVEVGVGGAGHLPEPDRVGVVLAGRQVVEPADQVTLGLDDEHGRGAVGADADGLAGQGRGDLAAVDEAGRGAAAAVHEVAVEDAGQRLDAVEVGRQAERGLRLTDGEDAGGLEDPERGRRAIGGAQGPPDLREDVIAERVARVVQTAIASWISGSEADTGAERPDGDRGVAAFDAKRLGRHTHIRVATAQQLLADGGEVGSGVGAGGDVEPLDDHGPVEGVGLGRPADDDAGGVLGRCVGFHGPVAVGSVHVDGPVGDRGARRCELVLHVASGGQVVHRTGDQQADAGPAREWGQCGGRTVGSGCSHRAGHLLVAVVHHVDHRAVRGAHEEPSQAPCLLGEGVDDLVPPPLRFLVCLIDASTDVH